MKEILFKTLIATIILAVVSSMVLFYILVDGYRDHKTFCSQYIPLLEQYHQEHNHYPESLDGFPKSFSDFRYSFEECGYQTNDDKYSFISPNGFMGVVGYRSENNKWWYD